MKKKVLIIFKYPHEWNLGVTDKFSNYYDTEFLYISNFKNIYDQFSEYLVSFIFFYNL